MRLLVGAQGDAAVGGVDLQVGASAVEFAVHAILLYASDDF